jgi:hypothetical protein
MRHLITPRTRLLIPAEGAESVTELVKPVIIGSTDIKVIAPGMTRYRNKNNKFVYVWSEPIKCNYYTLDPARKSWLEHICSEAADIPLTCSEEQDVLLRCGELADGSLLAAVVNLNYDTMFEIPLVCKKTPAGIQILSPSGIWEDAAYHVENNTIVVEKMLLPNTPAIFKLA